MKKSEVRSWKSEVRSPKTVVYQGKGGYGKRGTTLKLVDIVYTVVTRLEISALKAEIAKIDPDAFIIMNSIKDTKGGMIKKRPL